MKTLLLAILLTCTPGYCDDGTEICQTVPDAPPGYRWVVEKVDTPGPPEKIGRLESRRFAQHEDIIYLADLKRGPRSKKFLWLKPGKIHAYVYRCVDANGDEKTKLSPTKIKGYPDRCEFKESHPNLYAIQMMAIPASEAFIIISRFI